MTCALYAIVLGMRAGERTPDDRDDCQAEADRGREEEWSRDLGQVEDKNGQFHGVSGEGPGRFTSPFACLSSRLARVRESPCRIRLVQCGSQSLDHPLVIFDAEGCRVALRSTG